jgi:hypothetical protein
VVRIYALRWHYGPSTSTAGTTDTMQRSLNWFLMPDPSPHDNAVAANADLSSALHHLTALPLATHYPTDISPAGHASLLTSSLHTSRTLLLLRRVTFTNIDKVLTRPRTGSKKFQDIFVMMSHIYNHVEYHQVLF